MIDKKYRSIAIPEEFRILATLTGGIIGPGFPMLQETTIVSALVANPCGDSKSPDLAESTCLLVEFRWELLAGFECGYSQHGGSAHVVYRRCTDPRESKSDEFGWNYVIAYSPWDVK
jgi:hypothetical protein